MVHVSASLLAAVGCLLSLLVAGSPAPADSPTGFPKGYTAIEPGSAQDKTLEGKTLYPLEWRGVLEAGKPEVYLRGANFEDIEKQAKRLNPKYTIYAPRNATAEAEHRARREKIMTAERESRLVNRQTQAIHCGWPPNYAAAPDYYEVWQGVYYLQSITGDCRANPGPGSCGRVSCSWDNAIYYCNDNNVEHWEPCRWIGDVAGSIADSCWYFNGYNGFYVHGQAFDYRNWNTIVAWGDC